MIPERGFPQIEFEQRLEKAQRLMSEKDLDVVLFCTEAEVRYFTGFLTQFWQSPTRPWFLCLPGKGNPVAVIPEIGADCMERTWIEDIRTWSSPHPDDDGVSLLQETLEKLSGGSKKIGLPMGSESTLRMPFQDFKILQERLKGYEFNDATPLIQKLRMVKSELEIEKISHVCQLVSNVFETLPEWLLEEQTEIDVFRRFKIECLKEGVDDVSYLVGGAGLGGYSDIISPPKDKKLIPGDVLILDTGCTFDGYFCDFDRNYALQKADDDVRNAYRVVYQATDAGLEAAVPGNTAADVFRAMNRVLETNGAKGGQVGRMGHGLGMQLTEWPSNAVFDNTVLENGMVLTLEPGMQFGENKLMVHEENLVIREEGPQLLTRRAPEELPVIS
ncbi:MAG: Xaa-Pro peptidase family protein [SAR324 cluster bacterium]|nr:Xaa-Pro peptidase family protein [SAR324 cluster bacterium]